MQDRYDFPAVLHYNPDGRIGIVFPDLPGCVSQASSDAEAVKKATEALELHLYGMEEDGDLIPQPSRLADVPIRGCRASLRSGSRRLRRTTRGSR